MSLRVTHLNADASFLLTFIPAEASSLNPRHPHQQSQTRNRAPSTPASEASSSYFGYQPQPSASQPPRVPTFTVLLDPWISGSSQVLHPKFSFSRRKQAACIRSLAELPEPDIVIVSQNKPDHCHKQTLLQLSPSRSAKTIIYAVSGAAKTIRGWKFFPPERVLVLPRYGSNSSESGGIVRIPVPGCSPYQSAGEITIAMMSPRDDLTGLHQATGITYRSPGSSNPIQYTGLPTPPESPSRVFNAPLPDDYALSLSNSTSRSMQRPGPPPTSTTRSRIWMKAQEEVGVAQSTPSSGSFASLDQELAAGSNGSSAPVRDCSSRSSSISFNAQKTAFVVTRSGQNLRAAQSLSNLRPGSSGKTAGAWAAHGTPPIPPIPRLTKEEQRPKTSASLRLRRSFGSLRPSSRKSNSARRPSRSENWSPPPISVIFSPHGLPLPLMRAYLTQELGCPTHPLTLLLHCFNEIINPKLLGGTINSGCANGVDVAKYSNARCWISAHDEDIETSGLSVRWLKGKRYDVEQVQGLLDTHGRGGEGTMVNGDETVWGERGKQGGTRAVALNSGMSLTLGT